MIDEKTLIEIISSSSQDECRQMGELFLSFADAPRDAQWRSQMRRTLAMYPEAQRTDVERFCRDRGWEIIAPPFTEVESGKRADRPELIKALHRAKVTGATLVVAKLDRLSRNVAFLATLQDSGAKFIATDMPEANELTVHIMAAVAQAERKMTAARTKSALAAIKAKGIFEKKDGTPFKGGGRLGSPDGAIHLQRAGKGNAASVAASKAAADARARDLAPVLDDMRSRGITSLGELAAALNDGGFVTPRGGRWHASSVRNLVARLAP